MSSTHVPHHGGLTSSETSRITSGVAIFAICIALVLIAIKAFAWFSSGSVATLSSLADSTLDLIASLFTYFAVRFAAQPPDFNHRYGHGKAEAFAGLVQSGLVAISGSLVGMEAIKRLVAPQPLANELNNLIVMALSILLTGLLVVVQTRAMRQTHSVATQGDRAHYIADFAANLVVMIGIGATIAFGWLWADAVAGLAVAIWLAFGAVQVAKAAADQLLDHELPDSERNQIERLALQDPAIRAVHDLRTRSSGPYLHIQFHADLDPELSLRDAHEIVVAAEARIRAVYLSADIIVHPDPGDAASPHGHEHFGEVRAAG